MWCMCIFLLYREFSNWGHLVSFIYFLDLYVINIEYYIFIATQYKAPAFIKL